MSLENKQPIKAGNFKPLSLFVFFTLARERIFTKTHITENRFVIGPQNILFAGAYVHF